MTSPVTISIADPVYASHFDAYENLTGAWVTWSSTLTNLTVGNGTGLTKYRRTGNTVDFRFRLKLGSSSSVGTAPRFTLPFTPSAEYVASPDFDRIGFGTFFDTSTTDMRVVDPIYIASNSIQLNYIASSTTNNTTATAPWTWATGDILALKGTYYVD